MDGMGLDLHMRCGICMHGITVLQIGLDLSMDYLMSS
jgi:hypothetical protein